MSLTTPPRRRTSSVREGQESQQEAPKGGLSQKIGDGIDALRDMISDALTTPKDDGTTDMKESVLLINEDGTEERFEQPAHQRPKSHRKPQRFNVEELDKRP